MDLFRGSSKPHSPNNPAFVKVDGFATHGSKESGNTLSRSCTAEEYILSILWIISGRFKNIKGVVGWSLRCIRNRSDGVHGNLDYNVRQ
jgi:hypothetical protein